ncbi:PucR C-terminal helix-turn-helix domain-containing protein [Acetitomaculum ruminis DSM 5522]|uniref:PucR C-terminal helix-turn-helix domain-containing protein n=1 Tax=Acetitomaculum ruminis DSM 5522 TaxID=1120918 RepID=A0A1I0Y0E4_9FIRM|nr:helix-turn-helix domain-containing protein [Acetitomaculum ruminis]SFB06106.1 PucR C-terminal helix-turn-helix domain-containing protein [Acetitomaculum ruminis DSM 5522]
MDLSLGIIYEKLKDEFECRNIMEFSDRIYKPPRYFNSKNYSDSNLLIADSESVQEEKEILKHSGALIFIGEIDDEIMKKYGKDIFTIRGGDKVDARIIFNKVLDIYEHFDRWYVETENIIHENKGLRQLLEASSEYLDNPFVIVDSEFTYVAVNDIYSRAHFNDEDEKDPHTKVPYNEVNELITDPEFTRAEKKMDIFSYATSVDLLCYNIWKQGKFTGRVIMSNEKRPFNYTDRFVLRYLGQCTQRIFNIMNGFYFYVREYNDLRSLVSKYLESGYVVFDSTERVLNEIGWRRDDPYMVINLRFMTPEGNTLHARYLCSELEKKCKGSCALKHLNGVVWLINCNICKKALSTEFYSEIALVLREGLLKAGISRVYNDFTSLKSLYEQAVGAFDIGFEEDEMFWYYKYETYALDYFMKFGTSRLAKEFVVSPKLEILKEHDKKSNSGYYDTLKMYFDKKYNAAAAAAALFIHRSTFINRMEKIREIAQIDLEDWGERIYLEISFWLMSN